MNLYYYKGKCNAQREPYYGATPRNSNDCGIPEPYYVNQLKYILYSPLKAFFTVNLLIIAWWFSILFVISNSSYTIEIAEQDKVVRRIM